MRRVLLSLFCVALFAFKAEANTYSFTPNPGNLGNLDHSYFFTWGLNWSLPQGEKITSATLSFSKIWDWTVETDTLFIHLLDIAPMGVNQFSDTGSGDFFTSSTFNSYGVAQTKIGEWSDPFGGDASKAQDVSFTFNAAQLTALQGYISTAGPTGYANFGFGFDPDCHYYNNGVSFLITTSKITAVPEAGGTIALLGMGVGGLTALRRKLRG